MYFTIYDLVYNLCINVTPIFVCRKVSRAFVRSRALVSLRAQLFSSLEGLSYFSAPNAGWFSRVWRVWSGVSLQTCATFPAFVVVFALADHICRVFSLAFVVSLAGFGNICRVFYCITYINNAGISTLGILCIQVLYVFPIYEVLNKIKTCGAKPTISHHTSKYVIKWRKLNNLHLLTF